MLSKCLHGSSYVFSKNVFFGQMFCLDFKMAFVKCADFNNLTLYLKSYSLILLILYMGPDTR